MGAFTLDTNERMCCGATKNSWYAVEFEKLCVLQKTSNTKLYANVKRIMLMSEFQVMFCAWYSDIFLDVVDVGLGWREEKSWRRRLLPKRQLLRSMKLKLCIIEGRLSASSTGFARAYTLSRRRGISFGRVCMVI